MNAQRFPAGWDEQRVRDLLTELEARTEEDWIAADEASAEKSDRRVDLTEPGNDAAEGRPE